MKQYVTFLYRRYSIPIMLGAFVSFAFPPFPFGFLAYFSLIPLIFWSRSGSLKSAFKTGYWWGFGFHAAGLYWIINSTVAGGIMALLYLPLYSGLTLLLLRWLHKKYGSVSFFLFPIFWTAIEYLRGLGVLGFPWMSIAHTQSYYPVLLQYIDYTGVYGVTFWIGMVNTALFLLLERVWKMKDEKSLRRSLADRKVLQFSLSVVVLILVPWFYGRNVMEKGEWLGSTLKVSLVQGNVDMSVKSNAELLDSSFELYETLSYRAAQDNPDLIVWPETAALTFLKRKDKYDRWMRSIILRANAPILTGSFNYEPVENNGVTTFNTFNAAVFYQNELSAGDWYGKIRLVPFGEWFPYEDRFPIFRNLEFGQADFTRGNNYMIFSLYKDPLRAAAGKTTAGETNSQSIDYAVSICFESVFSDFIQKFTKKGAQFLVVITNNNWFGRTSSLYQHAQISVFRAIENRLGVAHCSNSGISLLIDPYGRVTAESGVFIEDVLTGEVYYRDKEVLAPFYTRNGEKFSQVILILGFVFFAGGFFRRNEFG